MAKAVEKMEEMEIGHASSAVYSQAVKTLPNFDDSSPELKEIGADMKASRVIVVGPYAPLNMFLKDLIPKLIPKSSVELVERAEINNRPYLDVEGRENNQQSEGREKKRQKPHVIIDFGKLMAMKASVPYIREARRAGLIYLLDKFAESFKQGDLPAAAKSSSPFSLDALLSEWDSPKTAEEIAKAMGEQLSRYLLRPLIEKFERVERDGEKQEPRVSLVPFKGYREWAERNGVYCLIPTLAFQKELGRNQGYDEKGNFLPNSVPVKRFQKDIEEDILIFAEFPMYALKLFQLYRAGANEQFIPPIPSMPMPGQIPPMGGVMGPQTPPGRMPSG